MSYYKNLVRGQYQIGDIVFGRGTNIIVEQFDAKPYDVNAQDYQVSRTDEMRFGYDNFKPTTVEIQMQVIYNWLLDPYKGTRTNFWHNMPTVNDLATEWRGNDVRSSWGALKPLYYCGRDNIGKIIFGRPGQFSAEKVTSQSTFVKCVGEFRRSDTYSYTATEYATTMTSNSTITRTLGNADTWFRVVINGPATNPSVQVGNGTIQVMTTLASGKSLEISSYPWARRVVNSDGVNLRSSVTGASTYLDKMTLPMGISNARILSGATSAYVAWRDTWTEIE